jgi:HAMP domain-containing protein
VTSRLSTIRAITTAVATIIVAIALVVGVAGLITALRHTLLDDVAEAGRAQASDVVSQLEAGRPPILEVAGSDEQLIQVLTPAGAVVASSPNVAGRPAVARSAPGESAQVLAPLDTDEFVAVAEGAQIADGPRIVVVARALVDVLDTTTVITRLLIIGLPVLVALVGLTTWFAVGRARAPVEAIRREVDEISDAQLHRRVPQPNANDEIGRLPATMNRMLERWKMRETASAASYPTHPMSCARRSPPSASTPRSHSPIPTG